MTLYSRILTVLAGLILITFSCTKPALIGSDFLEDEKASLMFRDSFDLTFFTEKTDSIIVHSSNVTKQLSTYLCGSIQDPVFGKYTASIYAQPLLPGVATTLKGSTLDSVILQLRYDTLGLYGTLEEPVTLEVYRMAENPLFSDEFYSNDTFSILPELLGSLTFIPKPYDDVTIIKPTDTVTVAPVLRIPLSVALMNDLLAQDSSVFENQTNFLNYFNGLHIKMTSGNNTMLGFNLLSTLTGMTFYYDKTTTQNLELTFIITSGSVKTVHMEHEYTGSAVADALTSDPDNDYTYIQGMSGVTSRVRLEDLNQLGDVIINQAQMEIYASFPPGDMESLYPPCYYTITQEKTDTTLVNSEDVAIALSLTGSSSTTENFNLIYGGKVTQVDPGPPTVYRYNMNVTNQIKDILAGNQQNIIYFNPFGKGNFPNRAVIFGPNHPTYAPRLRITYTSL
jgi:hypothetical protein